MRPPSEPSDISDGGREDQLSVENLGIEMMSAHPASEMFPLLESQAFDALVQDIKEHGQREPIVRYQGKVLDGRNRLRACLQLGIEPVIVDLTDDQVGDPLDYVKSKNIHRLHLEPHQRGEILLRLLESKGGAVGAHKGGRPAKDEKPRHRSEVSVAGIAKTMGSSESTVRRQIGAAEDYRAADPELRAKVDAGKLTPKRARKATEAAKAAATDDQDDLLAQAQLDAYVKHQQQAEAMRRWFAKVPAGFEKWVQILPQHGDVELRQAARQTAERVRASLREIDKVLAEPAAAADPVPDCQIVGQFKAKGWSLEDAVKARRAVMALPNDERARAIAYLLVHSRRHCRDLSYGRQVRLKRYQEWESREAERATRNASQQ